MTEIKDYQENTPKVKNNANNKENRTIKDHKVPSLVCMNQKCLLLCTWIILITCFCIVLTCLCMALLQNSKSGLKTHGNARAIQNENIFGNGFNLEDYDGNSNLNRRYSPVSNQRETERDLNRCQEKLCQISCAKVRNIYTALHDTIKESLCSSINVLLLEKQYFCFGILNNNWLPSNISLDEVIIRSSNINIIKSNAFNSPLFKDTFAISLHNMNLSYVESGSFLGLYGLKYLTIKSCVNIFEPAIFQPVQTTLLNLKLNACLKINGNVTLFDGSYLINLVYLDLSNNNFRGPLGKNLFKSTPNLKFLIITESQIQYIEENAFGDLTETLLFVNLSNNLLTTLAAAVFHPILVRQKIFIMNLAKNNWICNCQLEELAKLYRKYNIQFMEVLYCKQPQHLYGVSLSEVNFELENCYDFGTTLENNKLLTLPKGKNISSTTTEMNYPDMNSYGSPDMLKMRCVDSQASNLPEADLVKRNTEYLHLPATNISFELNLIPENNSVIIHVENPTEVLVIWFSEHLESSFINYNGISLDYECMRFVVSELLVGPLQENTTYTFCLVPYLTTDISPFNCLPLYVPPKTQKNLWLSEDNKGFTIGLLCFIFLLSTIAGALIAYFGIRIYPDLLEGSKNVLVVKKPDQVSYIATISEAQYEKQTSLKKRKSSTKPQLLLTEISPPATSSRPCSMLVRDLERLSSLKSYTTTCETPNEGCFIDYEVETSTARKAYSSPPVSPPPLPKRNSSV